MAFRNIIVENPAHISVKNSQLVIRTDTEHSAALEDISALLLENRQATITTAALSALGECGCCVHWMKSSPGFSSRSCLRLNSTGMNKFMRMLVFFDLPVQTKTQRREATKFRNFLLKDGYHMLQYSVYARVCNGTDAVDKHRERLRDRLPKNGAIRMLVITEKQYESIEILLGELTPADEPFESEVLSVF